METLKFRAVQWLALGILALVVIAVLPTPQGWVPPQFDDSDAVQRYRRYLVNIPPNSIVNLTGWRQTYVPLGLALFGRQPYILNFG